MHHSGHLATTQPEQVFHAFHAGDGLGFLQQALHSSIILSHCGVDSVMKKHYSCMALNMWQGTHHLRRCHKLAAEEDISPTNAEFICRKIPWADLS